jgi:hypothetical protein
MSAIATFYLLPVTKLDELSKQAKITVKKTFLSKVVTDTYWAFLTNNSLSWQDYDGPGYLAMNAIFFLEEKNIDLTADEYLYLVDDLIDKRQSSHYIYTIKHKGSLPQLSPDNYTVEDLRQFNEEFSEVDDKESAEATYDFIKLLYDNINKIQNDQQILLLIIG